MPPKSAAWFRTRTEALYLTISAAEVEAGIAKLRRTGSGRRADNLGRWFERILGDYGDRLLSFDVAAARIARRVRRRSSGRRSPSGLRRCRCRRDREVARIAILALNLRHFEELGIETLNPFNAV